MQQVNLLQALSQTKTVFSARMMYQLWVGTIVILLFLSCGMEILAWFKSREIPHKKQAVAQAVIAVNTTIKKYPMLSDIQSLSIKLTEMTRSVAEKKELWQKMIGSDQPQGFSDYMSTFAQYIPTGVWLDFIYINNNASDIAIKGNSVRPVLIPTFMRNLSHSSLFKNKDISILLLQENKNKDTVTFIIGTTQLAEKLPAENNTPSGTEEPTTFLPSN